VSKGGAGSVELVKDADSRVKVLIVDDSEDQLFLLRRYFEKAGCEVSVAGSAESAIAQYAIVTPDLAVIDLFLPGMDGWELAERVRVDNPDCAIAITSVLSEEHYPKAHHALPKPVTSAQVLSALNDYVPKWKKA
jgi:CheY-like chemotaxis protein